MRQDDDQPTSSRRTSSASRTGWCGPRRTTSQSPAGRTAAATTTSIGALPREVARGSRAAHYQNHALLNLVLTAQIIERQGYTAFDAPRLKRWVAERRPVYNRSVGGYVTLFFRDRTAS